MLTSIKKTVAILDAFVGDRREWSVLELSRALDMPQPSVHHVLSTLRALGWIAQDPLTKRYRLGIRLWEIGCAAVNFREVAETARPFLRELVQLCGETAHLGMISRETPREVIYVDRVDSQQPVRVVTALGSRAPSHSSAMGKAILAHNSEFESIVLNGPLERLTASTLVEPEALRQDLRQTRERGYSIGRGEFAGEMIGIAAPVRDHTGVVSLGIGIWAPAPRMTEHYIAVTAPALVTIADNISKALGFFSARI